MANYSSEDPRDTSHDHNDDSWVSEDDIKALADEREVFGEIDEVGQTQRILKENLPAVTLSVIKLARTAASETVRLNAAKYVIDRNLGKITDPDPTEDDPLRELYEDVTIRQS